MNLKKMITILVIIIIIVAIGIIGMRRRPENGDNNMEVNENTIESEESSLMEALDRSKSYDNGVIPNELEYIPDGYETPAEQQGTRSAIVWIISAILCL